MPESNLKKTFIKHYLLFTFLIFILILVIGTILSVYPFYKKTIIDKKSKIETAENSLEEMITYLEDLKKLKEDYQSIQEVKKEKLEFILPDEDEIPELFLMLDTIAQESGLNLTSISANKSTPQKESGVETPESDSDTGLSANFEILEITLNLAGGNYNKLKMFLDKVEKNIRLLDVKSISFEMGVENINMILSTYYSGNEVIE